MNWKPELDDLSRREAFAREMGGVDKVKRQHDQGRLTVRERIDKLIDPNSFHEVGAVAGVAEYDASGELTNLTPANCVFGRGRIDGRPVVVVGDDFTVRGGSADASISAKPQMAEEMAHDFRLPIVSASLKDPAAAARSRPSRPRALPICPAASAARNGTGTRSPTWRRCRWSGSALARWPGSAPRGWRRATIR